MMASKKALRRPAGVLLAFSVAVTFTLAGFAMPNPPEKADAAAQIQQQTGTLTADGSVTVNGNQAKSGMTILTQSVITTGSNAHAIVELGPLGRVELHSDTTATLQMLGSLIEAALSHCGKVTVTVPIGIVGRVTIPQRQDVHVKMIQGGKVTVRYGNTKEKFVYVHHEEYFDNAIDVNSDGGAAIFEVHCGHNPIAAYWWTASPLGLLFLLLGGGEETVTPPVLSPSVPG